MNATMPCESKKPETVASKPGFILATDRDMVTFTPHADGTVTIRRVVRGFMRRFTVSRARAVLQYRYLISCGYSRW